MALMRSAPWLIALRYGALGLPLAFVTLPLYVVLPQYYATHHGVNLAVLGALLLGARFTDAVADPLMGRWADQLLSHAQAAWKTLALASAILAIAFYALFSPPAALSMNGRIVWCGAVLVVTYLSYSAITLIHQAWGVRLAGHNSARQAHFIAWREGQALVGVLLASALFGLADIHITTVVLAASLVIALGLLGHTGTLMQAQSANTSSRQHSLFLPFRTRDFRRLLGVYLVNGIAGSIPATLVLFFIEDRLQAPQHQAFFLSCYFLAAVLAMPLWLYAAKALGLARTWFMGMALTIAVFAGASQLGAGDIAAYTLVCLLSGAALGADLSMPSSLLTRVIDRAGHHGQAEGLYLGWWHFATKLNLALAAGLALPLLALWGYKPGQHSEPALAALSLAYCLLPCALKCLAAVLLWTQKIHLLENPSTHAKANP
jgi:glycoside/pentoside/hexuronide:cation symporter, GPH family